MKFIYLFDDNIVIKSRYHYFLFLAFSIILACLLILFKTGYVDKQAPQAPPKTQEQKNLNAEYKFSYPSNGTLTKTQKINVDFLPNDEALGWADNIDRMKIGQNVILYTKNNIVLPLGGVIKSLQNINDAQSKVTIQLPKNTQTQYLSSDVDVIIAEYPHMQRFPLSALQKDINDNYYVWGIQKTEKEGYYNVEKTWLDQPIIGWRHFTLGSIVNRNYQRIILNPDSNIEEHTAYTMSEVDFKAPSESPIKNALRQYETLLQQKRLEAHRRQKKNCGEGGQNMIPESEEGLACGKGAKRNMTPEEIFNSILTKQPPLAITPTQKN